ncbi:MAG TPA: hypothetical protein VF520_12035 [Thermoleophilaceae bacterium]|jgi:hypothetical protein
MGEEPDETGREPAEPPGEADEKRARDERARSLREDIADLAAGTRTPRSPHEFVERESLRQQEEERGREDG